MKVPENNETELSQEDKEIVRMINERKDSMPKHTLTDVIDKLGLYEN